jgi:hypothetical protein
MSNRFYTLCVVVLLLGAICATGCARAARDTTGFAIEKNITVAAPFEQTWQTVKAVLREKKLEIYTRDKRGTFVAFTDMHRGFGFLQPSRTKYSIELGEVSANETAIYIGAVKQVYGVTMLTYPDWHDRKLKNDAGAQELLTAIQDRIAKPAEAPAAASAPETAPAPAAATEAKDAAKS